MGWYIVHRTCVRDKWDTGMSTEHGVHWFIYRECYNSSIILQNHFKFSICAYHWRIQMGVQGARSPLWKFQPTNRSDLDVQYMYTYVCTHVCAVHTDGDKYFEILTRPGKSGSAPAYFDQPYQLTTFQFWVECPFNTLAVLWWLSTSQRWLSIETKA